MCKSFVVLISLDLQITEDITTNWFAHKLHIFASLTLALIGGSEKNVEHSLEQIN